MQGKPWSTGPDPAPSTGTDEYEIPDAHSRSSTGCTRSTRMPTPSCITRRRSSCSSRRFSRRSRPTCASTWSRRRCSSATPTRARLRRRRTSAARAADPLDRVLSRKVEVAASAWRRRSSTQHGGEVPATMDALVELPGRRPQDRERRPRPRARRAGPPGRSSRAARREPDRHRRRRRSRESSSSSCARALPPERWTRTSDTLILHGRRICRPKPLCDDASVRDDCDYFRLGRSRASRGRAATGERRPAKRTPWNRRRVRTTSSLTRCVDSAAVPRRDAEHRDRRRGRAVARAARARWRSSRRTRCSACTRARRSPSARGTTATRCPIGSCSSRVRIEREAEDDDDLVVAIGETLIHEIGHYFGLSEEEIEEIEERYWRGDADGPTSLTGSARKRFGQHFLEPAWVARSIARDRIRTPDDTFFEIGPAAAPSRGRSPQRPRAVVAVRDRSRPGGGAREAVRRRRYVEGDFLRPTYWIARAPCRQQTPSAWPGNLPYNVASPILFKLLAWAAAPGVALRRRDGDAPARGRRSAGRHAGLARTTAC